MIPEWMDLVIWGNEHECQPSLIESLVGTFRIFQPGSSIATSLVEGESMLNPKHMGLIEIKGRFFRMHPIPYTQIRPYLYSEIALSTIPDLNPNDSKIEDKIRSVLASRVRHMIEEARQSSTAVAEAGSSQEYVIRRPEMVLVRLRVDHVGYPTINQQRFGTLFMDTIANPSSVLFFAKKKRETYGGVINANTSAETAYRNVVGVDIDELDDPMSRVRIEDLVKESLDGNQKQLNILIESDMAQAIDDFVLKKHVSAITDIVQETLEKTQEALFKNIAATNKEQIAEHALKIRKKEEIERLKKLKESNKKQSSGAKELSIFANQEGDNDVMSDTSENEPAVTKSGRSTTAAKRTGRNKQSVANTATVKGKCGAGRGRGADAATRKSKNDEESLCDSSSSEEVVTNKRSRGGTKVKGATKAPPKAKGRSRNDNAKINGAKDSKTSDIRDYSTSKRASSRLATSTGKRKYSESSAELSEDEISDVDSDSDVYVDDEEIEDSYQEADSRVKKNTRSTASRVAKSKPLTGNKRGRGPSSKGNFMVSPDMKATRLANTTLDAVESLTATDAVDLTEDW